MKDSVGSTVLMKIFAVFMVVYIILMASILNYTKTFRIKNQIINIINRQGGYNASARQEIADYIEKSSMYMECTLLEGSNDFGSDPNNKKCEIKEYVVEDAAGGKYYKVKVYVTFQFPLIKQTLQIPITGETKRLFDAGSADPNPPKYVIINSEYNPVSDKVGLKVEKASCGGGGNGCCQSSICPGSRLIGDGKGGCTCENGGTPTYDSAKRGRKPYPSAGNACAWCWSCKATPVTIDISGDSTSWAPYRTISIDVTDSSYAGFTCGSYGEKSGILVNYDSSNGEVKTDAIKCSIVGNGPDTTKSYNVYVRKASTVPDGPCANCACKTKPACPVGECTRCNTSKNEWTTCKPCLFEN